MAGKKSNIIAKILLFGSLLAGIIYLLRVELWYFPPQNVEIKGNSDWFLMVKLPEISAQYESSIETMKIRMELWLQVLIKAGFKPIRFSDVLRLREAHKGLPERALVVFVDPGYRKTYEIMAPIFKKHNCPILWLTRKASVEAADRSYLTKHALREMRKVFGWDAGFAVPTGDFTVEGVTAQSNFQWTPQAGAFALNRGLSSHVFHYLTVKADWTPDEFLNRILAETPATAQVSLTKASIQSRDWGIAKLDLKSQNVQFDLYTPKTKRGTKLFWYSTLGVNDFRLQFSVNSFFGEIRLQLRSDEETGRDVHLIINKNKVLIEEQSSDKSRTLAGFEQVTPASKLSLDVTLTGDHMAVSINGGELKTIENLSLPEKNKGLVQLYISDSIRGTAQAQGMSILFTPKPLTSEYSKI